jgi:hypothetical protein
MACMDNPIPQEHPALRGLVVLSLAHVGIEYKSTHTAESRADAVRKPDKTGSYSQDASPDRLAGLDHLSEEKTNRDSLGTPLFDQGTPPCIR